MQIIIHRGAHQIGGCCTEIRTEQARILIDLGQELPKSGEEQALLSLPGITTGGAECGGVFFTHYHGDHIGLLDTILPDIPVYIEAASKDICVKLYRRLAIHDPAYSTVIDRLESAIPLIPSHPVQIGDLRITPFTVDHSAYNACMFLIEGEGKKILHTGDFRTHGFRGKGVLSVLRRYVGQVDVLITEGTNLGRSKANAVTEHDLSRQAAEYLKRWKNVFVLCSSTNIDRLAGLYAAAKRARKPFICDGYQADILRTVTGYGGKRSSLYDFSHVLTYGDNLLPLMREKGFCIPVRVNDRFHSIMGCFPKEESILLYSMWAGYQERDPKLKQFVSEYHWEYFHTSGHASKTQLQLVCREAMPRIGVIPIHTEAPDMLNAIVAPYPVLRIKDGEALLL